MTPPLEGMWFITLNEDGVVERQGRVEAVDQSLVRVQYFSWIMGEPTVSAVHDSHDFITPITVGYDPNTVVMFDSLNAMSHWLEHGDGMNLRGRR